MHDFVVEFPSIVNWFINKFCAQLENSSILGLFLLFLNILVIVVIIFVEALEIKRFMVPKIQSNL